MTANEVPKAAFKDIDELLDWAIHISPSENLLAQAVEGVSDAVACECEVLVALARALPEVTHQGASPDFTSTDTLKTLFARESAKRLDMINETHEVLVQLERESCIHQMKLLKEIERRGQVKS